MARQKMDTKDLIEKIEKMTKERLLKEQVVSLDEYRQIAKKKALPTILIVDDDDTVRKGLTRLFEGRNFRVLAAADGTQLSSVLDDSPIDMILLDIGLPWVNGFELAQLLREHSDLKSIPIIFLSGQTSDLDIKKAFQVGASDFIKKPFQIEDVIKAVEVLLKLNK